MTLLPAATDTGEAELVITRSAWAAVATTSAAVALLLAELGSVMEEAHSRRIVDCGTGGSSSCDLQHDGKAGSTRSKCGIGTGNRSRRTHRRITHVQVRRPLTEKKLVFGGVVSVKLALVAVLGPALVTTWV